VPEVVGRGTLSAMKRIETVIADPNRFLKHGGCYARTPKAVIAVLLEIARDGEGLSSVWLDCDTDWSSEVVDFLVEIRQEGEFQDVVLNLYGEMSPKAQARLEHCGYEVLVREISDHQSVERGESLFIAPR
jgi:hypothetical protein